MCALAHMFESAGIATVTIALVRLHAKTIRPPRALFVPFEPGRPLGAPNAPEEQRDVLLAALQLLEHPGPTPVLVDYPEAGGPPDRAPWQPPFDLPGDPGEAVSAAALKREFGALQPVYGRAVAEWGRTTFGNSGVDPDAVVNLICQLLENDGASKERFSARQVRFAVDDLKTLYGEAATFLEPAPSSWQVRAWFWRRTIAGQALIAVRRKCMVGSDKALRLVADHSFIPGQWLDELGL